MDRDQAIADIVTAGRALALQGCGAGIGGHVSIRASSERHGRDAFWINAFDRTLGEMTVDDVVLSDHHGAVIEGNRAVSLGSEFHGGIYDRRTDVNAIVHTHGFWGTALASLARPLKMRHNLCCLFHDDQVMSPDDSFDSIGSAIGSASTIIIPWHGCITVGTTIGRATALHVTLEEMARLDVTLEPTEAPEIPEDRRSSLKKLVDEQAGYLEQTWDLLQRQVEGPS
ncbi:MAG: class II aldolase/adducin family protein [Acidimicrobiales bacterium]